VSSLSRLAFKIALHPAVGSLVGYGFQYAAPLLPVQKLFLTPKTIVFYHPRTAWKTHYLIIPRKKIKNLFRLTEPLRHDYFQDVLLCAAKVIREKLEPTRYALIVNGGKRQDVLQVHFHLTGEERYVEPLGEMPKEVLLETPSFTVHVGSQAKDKLHLVYIPKDNVPPLSQWPNGNATQINFSLSLNKLEQRFQLVQKGFSLVFQEASAFEQKRFVIHLVAGGPLRVG
jgi:diadenosine tetraphosphate (Ap4A) HIT family hydrolase